MLVFVVIFLIVSVQPAFLPRQQQLKKITKYKKMKKETLNTYLNVFVLFAIAGSIMTFISGIDSIFDNPLGLIAVSIFLGVVIAAIIVGGYAILNWIAPKWTQKIINGSTYTSGADEEMK